MSEGGRHRGRRKALDWRYAVIYAVLVVGSAAMVMPLYWLLSSSVKSEAAVFASPPQWIPRNWMFSNYSEIFRVMPFLRYYLNTVIITALAVTGQVASSAVVGYGFARMRFPGRRWLFIVLLATIMIPYPVTLIPTYILFKYLGWLNTFLPLIVPYWFGTGAFFIFLMRQFYLRMSREIEDAARIDGAGSINLFLRIVLPQVKAALGVVAILGFLGHWNDFLGPLIYLDSPNNYTLALGINLFRGENTTQWNLLMASSAMATLPCVVLFFLAQRYFIRGISFSGLQ